MSFVKYGVNTDKAVWNEEGFKVDGALHPDEIIKAAGLDFEVEKVNTFDVIDMDALLDGKWDNLKRNDTQFNVRRIDTHKILTPRTVTGRYQPCQNSDLFHDALTMAKDGRIVIETADCLDGGARVYMVGRFTDSMDADFRVSPDARSDMVLPRIIFHGTHDGTGTLRIGLIAHRVWCANMIAKAGKGYEIRIRHTRSVNDRIKMMGIYLEGLRNEWIENSKRFKMMAERVLTEAESMQIIRYVVQNNEKERSFPLDELSTRTRNRIDAIKRYYNNPDLGTFGKTAWDMYNAVTGFNTHERNIKEEKSRFNNLLDGPGFKYESRVDEALEMIGV